MLSPLQRAETGVTEIDRDCYDFLREMHYSERAASWLSLPDNHEACMRELHDIEKAIRILGKGKKQSLLRPSPSGRKRQPAPAPAPAPAENGAGVVIQMGDDMRFQMLHRRLSSYHKDGKRFLHELEKISRENPDLPETFHAWLVWSGHWDRLLKYLEANIEFCINQQGEISIIANMLKKGVIASLRANPDILKKAPMTINYGERTITLNNLYEIYQHLGLSAIEVIRTILAQLEVKSKEYSESIGTASQPFVRLYNTPRNENITGASKSHGILSGRIIHHAGVTIRRRGIVVEAPVTLGLGVNYSERILRAFRHIQGKVNGSLSLGFGPEDLVENAFGSISLSSRVPQGVREMLKAYFPKGYFDQAQLTK